MMPKLFITAKAKSDLKDIGRYTEARWGKAQRKKYLNEIANCMQELAKNPRLGTACDELHAGLRFQPQGSHLIFFTSNNGQMVVVRILHQSMDIERRLDGN
jgi:toxin ParE1/3/4